MLATWSYVKPGIHTNKTEEHIVISKGKFTFRDCYSYIPRAESKAMRNRVFQSSEGLPPAFRRVAHIKM